VKEIHFVRTCNALYKLPKFINFAVFIITLLVTGFFVSLRVDVLVIEFIFKILIGVLLKN